MADRFRLGTIEEPLSTTATLTLEVRQLQAVRNP